MKRPIKYKVWDYQNNRWAKESEANISMGFEFGVNDYYINIDGERMDRWSFVQFTGLTAKNGKEIYEGDIVHGVLTIENDNYDFTGEIIFEDACFRCDNADFELRYYENLVIIGNIYENPELL